MKAGRKKAAAAHEKNCGRTGASGVSEVVVLPGGARPSTMADIARLCGVSVITVSRVFNHPDKVKPGTKEKILAACRELGFSHNMFASLLVRAKPNPIIGFIASSVGDPLFQTITHTVQQLARESGMDLLLGLTGFDTKQERQYLERYFQYRVAGIVVYQPTLEFCRSGLMPQNVHCKTLMLWDRPENGEGNYIGQDPSAIPALAVDHLAALGHTEMALIAGSPTMYRAHMRRRGFADALKRNGLQVREKNVSDIPRSSAGISMAATIEAGYAAATRLLRQTPRPTALVLSSDDIAVGAVLAARDLGLDVPGECSFVSLAELRIASMLDLALTTVRTSLDSLRAPMAEFFAQSRDGVLREPFRHSLHSELIAGESSVPPVR